MADDGDTPLAALSAKLETAGEDWAAQLADELLALSSIYDEEAITILPLDSRSKLQAETSSGSDDSDRPMQVALARSWTPGQRLRLRFRTQIEPAAASSSAGPVEVLAAVTLPERYPSSSHAPQMQLLNRFAGAHAIDHVIFGKVLRCFLHDPEVLADKGRAAGLQWTADEPVLFEALEWLKETLTQWYDEREREVHERAVQMQGKRDARSHPHGSSADAPKGNGNVTDFDSEDTARTARASAQDLEALAKRLKLVSSEPIVDRKSTFIGHCCHITDPSQVPLIIEHILSDKRVARAAHPKIHAWVCAGANGVVQRDCDDDGETAAGGRLAHLLQILSVENVLVVVTRWFGGIHLGPDRFKHINRAARDALEAGGFVAQGAS